MSKYYTTTLQKGSKGDEVKEWQNFLNTQGYGLSVDGDFGDKTYAATVEWQKKNGLGADGIVGDNTWGKAGYSSYSTISTPTDKPTIEAAPDTPTLNTTSTRLPTTDTTSWDDTEKGQAAGGAYNTAKDNVNNYEDFTYNDYSESDKVKEAGAALDSHNANKPGEYSSQWQGKIDELMNSILNREKFSYDLNGDALYQQYKDKYVQQGKLAMGDAIGQASAMTGGYGNSYAQSVGQQQYQASLDNLNDIVPQLYQMALDKYNMEGQDLYNQYGMVADRENLDYSRYRDTVSDWYTDRDYLTGRYDTERGFDYNKYIDDKNFAYTLHQDEYQRLLDSLGIAQSDYYDGANMYYTEQSNRNNEAWKQYQAAEEARQYGNSLIQQNWQNEFNTWDANTQNAWKEWQADEANRQSLYDDYWKQKEWDLTNEQWAFQKSQASASGSGGNGGSGNGGNGGIDLSTIPGINTTDASWFDENGNFKKATYQGLTEDGKCSYRIDGKTVIVEQGVNPYTKTVNPDLKHGAWDNPPYQPNNVDGKKLSKSGIQDYMNGVLQNVWKTPDGKLWIWDGTQNKYEEYHE